MADPQTEPQDTQAPTSYEDAVKSAAPSERTRVYIRKHSDEPKDTDKPVSFDDVFSQFKDSQKKTEDKPKEEGIGDTFRRAKISDENKRLQFTQGTHQSPDKDSYIGPAVSGRDLFGADDKDPDADTNYYKDEKGNYQAADHKNHVMFRDPDSGEYGIYGRDHSQNMSGVNRVLGGVGSVVQEGMQAAPTRLASTAGIATRGQKALGAAKAVEESTGARVPVAQNAVTENALTPKIAGALEHLPGGSQPFDAAAAKTEAGLSQAQHNATAGATSPESAGNAARTGIEGTATPKTGLLAKKVGDAYDRVDAHIPSDATHDLSETRKIAGDIQQRFEATRGESGTNKINPTINEVLSAVTDPKGVSYQGLKGLRTRIGEMLENGTNISETGVSDKELRGLYKGLTDDLQGMVEDHGGARGLSLWKRANAMARVASERRETLGKILGTNRSDEGIFGTIERMAGSTNAAAAKTLALAKKSIPADEWNEIAQTVASRLGRVRTDAGTHFDPSKFVKNYDKMSERGKSLLFGDQQRLRKALDSISDLSKFKDEITHPGPVAHLIAASMAINHGGGEGLLGKLGHIMAAVTSMKVVGNMLSKPATAESVAKWMQGYKIATLKPTRGNVSLFQRASESLANDAAKEDREHIGEAASKAGELAKYLITLVPFPGK